MLIIIPLLTINDPDISLSLGVQLVHKMSILNQTQPETYEVSFNNHLLRPIYHLILVYHRMVCFWLSALSSLNYLSYQLF